MTPFTLALQSATQTVRMDDVESFIARDASGSGPTPNCDSTTSSAPAANSEATCSPMRAASPHTTAASIMASLQRRPSSSTPAASNMFR